MLDDIKPDEILFLDIETVPQQSSYEALDDTFKYLWDKKTLSLKKEEETSADIYSRAGIYAEFGKIICISTGYLYFAEEEYHLRLKTFYSHHEKELLDDFRRMLNAFAAKKNVRLCAHNGKEFDFPYISRRTLINSLPLPKILEVAGKKPWEVNFIDTMDLWRFGDYKNYTSLELLTKVFNIPTPKDDINGSMVAEVYWKENNLERIVTYCEKDVIAIVQLFLRYRNEPLVRDQCVQSITTFL
jgi:3'-5' exonuclease